jgi:hypothetical protein
LNQNVFRIDECHRLDVPAIIRYILSAKDAKNISYVCHSMGCGLITIALNEEPKLNDIIRKMTFSAPGTYVHHQQNPFTKGLAAIPPRFLMVSQNHCGKFKFGIWNSLSSDT